MWRLVSIQEAVTYLLRFCSTSWFSHCCFSAIDSSCKLVASKITMSTIIATICVAIICYSCPDCVCCVYCVRFWCWPYARIICLHNTIFRIVFTPLFSKEKTCRRPGAGCVGGTINSNSNSTKWQGRTIRTIRTIYQLLKIDSIVLRMCVFRLIEQLVYMCAREYYVKNNVVCVSICLNNCPAE